jgi:YD repeat-containing protein
MEVASVVADGPSPLATFTYDLAGNRLSKNLDNGVQSVYSCDAVNRLTQIVHQPGVETLGYTYDSMNRRTNVIVNGVSPIILIF